MTASEYCPVTPEIIEDLKRICGDAFVHYDGEKMLEKYSRDKVPGQSGHLPEVVVMPKTAREVAEVVKLANREMIPITPRAAGSGLSGGAVPIYGGILLTVERMNDILEIDDKNLMAVVEPGVVTNKLDEVLQKYGLFFAGYPMSEEFCFIGGNVAENAGGGRAVKYGVTGQYIQGLEIEDLVQIKLGLPRNKISKTKWNSTRNTLYQHKLRAMNWFLKKLATRPELLERLEGCR